jgi:hypothetical protein
MNRLVRFGDAELFFKEGRGVLAPVVEIAGDQKGRIVRNVFVNSANDAFKLFHSAALEKVKMNADEMDFFSAIADGGDHAVQKAAAFKAVV